MIGYVRTVILKVIGPEPSKGRGSFRGVPQKGGAVSAGPQFPRGEEGTPLGGVGCKIEKADTSRYE